ncbi:MAG: HEPN domain-containing protein [Armatimonadota bacterium]|nr:HEPN domain-containing protein [Armatimonadota bacterium]
MPHDPNDADAPERWLRNARADLAMGSIELPAGAVYELLCFHAQQAAEKSIKALLLHLGTDFPYTHSIQLLVALLPADAQSVPLLKQAERLSSYAALTRYPGELPPVTEPEYAEAVRIAEAVVEWVEDYISRHM